MSDVDQKTLVKWLRQHAPELAPLVEKDLTLSDVHQTTALGNQRSKKTQKPIPVVAYKPQSKDNVVKEKTRKTLERALKEVDFDPEQETFDSAGSDSRAFDWFVNQVQSGDVAVSDNSAEPSSDDWDADRIEPSVKKLKLKTKTTLEIDPEEIRGLSAGGLADYIQRLLAQNAQKAAGTRCVLFMRHGATHLNNNDTSVDRIRGWKDVPLSDEGKKEAAKLAKKVAKNPPDAIVCSDLKRARDTAKMVADACDMDFTPDKAFRPWDVGKFAGQSSKIAVPKLIKYAVETPDEDVPGGESFNTFYGRFMTGLADALDKYEGTLGVVTHHRNERAVVASEAAGWDGIDGKEFGKKGEGTAGFEYIEVPPDKVRAAGKTGVTKWHNPPEDYSKIWEETSDDWGSQFHVTKIDRERQMVFGVWSVTTINGDPVIDKQDDIIPTEELEKAVYNFVLKSRAQGDMHKEMDVGRCVESMIFTKEKERAINEYLKEMGSEGAGIDLGMEFWWGGFKVDDAQTWADIKSGKLPEFSIGGRGERTEVPT